MLPSAIRVLVPLALALAVIYAAVLEGRRTGAVAFAVWLAVVFVAVVWLPRAAHRAFRRGDYKRARLLYKLLRLWALRSSARAGIDISLAACSLAVEDWTGALEELDRLDVDELSAAARAAWFNNRAYALARSGRDVKVALEYSDQAIVLRPDVAGFRHTRGVVLLALGRVDEAIAELDKLWSQLAGQSGDEVPLLEAERCYDLGCAWRQKGEGDYAVDYFHRARRASPQSRWATRASEHLEPTATPNLAEFLDG